MGTLTTPDATSLSAVEFEVPCNALVVPCEYPARWGLWLSHTVGECNVTHTICDMHKPMVDAVWRAAMDSFPRHCLRCREPVSRKLEDNVKWIAL